MKKFIFAIALVLSAPVSANSERIELCGNLQDLAKVIVEARNAGAEEQAALDVAKQTPKPLRAAVIELVETVWDQPRNSINAQAASELTFLSCLGA